MEVENLKYTDLVIGLIIFAGFLTFAFFASGTLGNDYESDDFQTYLNLETEYNETNIGLDNESEIRQEKDALSVTEAFDTASNLVSGALKAMLLVPKTLLTTTLLIDRVVEDMGVPHFEFVANIIKSIIGVVLIVMVINVISRMKVET